MVNDVVCDPHTKKECVNVVNCSVCDLLQKRTGVNVVSDVLCDPLHKKGMCKCGERCCM